MSSVERIASQIPQEAHQHIKALVGALNLIHKIFPRQPERVIEEVPLNESSLEIRLVTTVCLHFEHLGVDARRNYPRESGQSSILRNIPHHFSPIGL